MAIRQPPMSTIAGVRQLEFADFVEVGFVINLEYSAMPIPSQKPAN